MFTGIIQALGRVEQMCWQGTDARLVINVDTKFLVGVSLGDSIAVNGVCLTVIDAQPAHFSVDVSKETIDCTSLASVKAGMPLNLEKALRLEQGLDGHLVMGHVDGVGCITKITPEGRSVRFVIKIPEALTHYMAVKGSVTIDGVSLTVNQANGNHIEVNIVPHTQIHTLFQQYRLGDRVNLEVDVIARYLERLMQRPARDASQSRMTPDWLKTMGIIQS